MRRARTRLVAGRLPTPRDARLGAFLSACEPARFSPTIDRTVSVLIRRRDSRDSSDAGIVLRDISGMIPRRRARLIDDI